jgi:hypothetical protein
MWKCARRTGKALEVGDDLAIGWVEHYGDLGTAWHAFQEVYLTDARSHVGWRARRGADADAGSRRGHVRGLAGLPFVLPWDALDALRGMVLGFCDEKWVPRLLANADYEEELRAEVVCPDGEVRVFKGTPDVLMFDPPDGVLIVDGKSGRGKPPAPRKEPEPGEVIEGYLGNMFQGESYCYLVLRKYPSVRKARFKEFHVRSRQIREITVTRDGMEHIERKLGLQMALLDRAIDEGPESKLWRPRPGKHCAKQCPVARSCPIPEEMRGDGAIETQERADEVAAMVTVAKAQYTQGVSQLKTWQEMGNRPGRANESEEWRWGPEPDAWKQKGGGRKFDIDFFRGRPAALYQGTSRRDLPLCDGAPVGSIATLRVRVLDGPSSKVTEVPVVRSEPEVEMS